MSEITSDINKFNNYYSDIKGEITKLQSNINNNDSKILNYFNFLFSIYLNLINLLKEEVNSKIMINERTTNNNYKDSQINNLFNRSSNLFGNYLLSNGNSFNKKDDIYLSNSNTFFLNKTEPKETQNNLVEIELKVNENNVSKNSKKIKKYKKRKTKKRGKYNKVSLNLKLEALKLYSELNDYNAVSEILKIPIKSLKRWEKVGITNRRNTKEKINLENESKLLKLCLDYYKINKKIPDYNFIEFTKNQCLTDNTKKLTKSAYNSFITKLKHIINNNINN